ncbi:MAG: YgcG family protein, partial [Methylococcales bacterium]
MTFTNRIRQLGFGVLLLLLCPIALALVAIPDLSHRVTDLTATLTQQQISALENKLAAIEAKQGSQLAVLIVSTTQPEAIEQYSIRVAEAWKIGRKKIDDGVILIAAKDDRKLRIEVGYGLEGAIPDAIAKRVISETITPYFKAGDFAGGIDAGVMQLAQLIAGESLPPPTAQNRNTQQDDGRFMLILIAGVLAGWFLSAIFGRTLGGAFAALGSGTIAGLILGFGFSIIMGLIVFFIVGIHQSSGRGWSSGGFGGGGFGGGGSS